MPVLVLINGPPGIGKSTLAARYVESRPLALNLDIDAIRTSLGRWREHNESKLMARRLATGMARSHLQNGHDVVIPQLVARTDFIEQLDEIAQEESAGFRELLLLDTKANVIERFRSRRAALDGVGAADHPEEDIDPEHDADVVGQTYDALVRLLETRPNTHIIYTLAGHADEAYDAMCEMLAATT